MAYAAFSEFFKMGIKKYFFIKKCNFITLFIRRTFRLNALKVWAENISKYFFKNCKIPFYKFFLHTVKRQFFGVRELPKYG